MYARKQTLLLCVLCGFNLLFYYRSSSSGLYPHDPIPAAPPLRDHPLPHRIEPALPVHHLDQGQEDLRPFRSRGDAVSNEWLSVHHEGMSTV
jgi:hypothetical protein